MSAEFSSMRSSCQTSFSVSASPTAKRLSTGRTPPVCASQFFSRYAVLITWFGDCFSSLRSADCNICHMVYSRFSIAFLQHQDGGIAQASLYFMRHAFWCARTQHWFDKPPEPSSPLGCGADFFNRCCVRVRCGFFTGARFGCSLLSRLFFFFLEEGSLTSSDGTRTA